MSLLLALALAAAPAEKIDCLENPSENGEDSDRVALYLTPDKIDELALSFSEYDNKPMLDITFSDTGNTEFLELQEGRIGKSIALCIGNSLLIEPRLNEPILVGKAQISGNFTVEQIKALIAELSSQIVAD